MRRIVKETLSNRDIKYRVETDRCFFGLIKCKWHTDTVTIPMSDGDITVLAVFDTLKEAQIHCGIDPNPVIREEIITVV